MLRSTWRETLTDRIGIVATYNVLTVGLIYDRMSGPDAPIGDYVVQHVPWVTFKNTHTLVREGPLADVAQSRRREPLGQPA